MAWASQRWKQGVRGGLAAILVANLILVFQLWRGAAAAPEVQQAHLERLERSHSFLSGDVGRAQRVADHLPEITLGSDQFLAGQFLPLSTGYSEVVADLSELAGKTGVTASGVSFRQREVRGRNLAEVEIATAVEGDYFSLVKYVNAVERSKNFYLIDDLTLSATPQGAIKMNVRLRTYFRPAPGAAPGSAPRSAGAPE